MTMLDSEFKRVVAAHLEGSGMTGNQLGEWALGAPGFVADLNRGRSPRLDAADRVLQFLGVASISPRVRGEVEAFLTITRCKPAALGTRAAGDSSFVRELRYGAGPTLASVDGVRSWMHRFADEADRIAIAWLLAHDDAAAPLGLQAVVAFWTDDAVRMLDETTFLTVPEAAAFLEMSQRTLNGYRVSGGGPAFHRFGNRIVYARFDLEAWVRGNAPANGTRRRMTAPRSNP